MSVFIHSWRALGCAIQVQVAEQSQASLSDLAQLPAQLEALEARLSRFRADSELRRFNDQAGRWVAVSDILWEALQAAQQAAYLTDGLFNPFVAASLVRMGYDRSFDEGLDGAGQLPPPAPIPDWRGLELDEKTRRARIPSDSALDLGGIGKGWAAQRLLKAWPTTRPALLDFGGDLIARGAPSGRAGWTVALHDPFQDAPLLYLELRDQAIATSGTDYRRWSDGQGRLLHHLIDPRSGQPAQSDILTISVIHPSIVYAESYAKAALILGSQDGLSWLNQQWHTHALAILSNGSVVATPQFTSFITQGATA